MITYRTNKTLLLKQRRNSYWLLGQENLSELNGIHSRVVSFTCLNKISAWAVSNGGVQVIIEPNQCAVYTSKGRGTLYDFLWAWWHLEFVLIAAYKYYHIRFQYFSFEKSFLLWRILFYSWHRITKLIFLIFIDQLLCRLCYSADAGNKITFNWHRVKSIKNYIFWLKL